MLTSDRNVTYLDSSALVKLVVHEPESEALGRFLAGHPNTASSDLALVEVVRAVLSQGADAIARADATLAAVDLLRLNVPLLNAAARLDPPVLRSLGAIHLAAALELGPSSKPSSLTTAGWPTRRGSSALWWQCRGESERWTG